MTNKPQAPAILDVEASGLDSHSYPIEIGVVRSDGFRYCSLIKPFDDWTHWDKSAEGVHQISRKDLFKRGASAPELCRHLNTILFGKTVYSDGWVVDLPWLNKLYSSAGIEMKFTLSPIENILSEIQLENWHKVKQSVIKVLNIKRHRASNDALIIQQTYINSLLLTHSFSSDQVKIFS